MHYLTIFLLRILASGLLIVFLVAIALIYLNKYLKIKKFAVLQKYRFFFLAGIIICALIVFFAGQAINSFVSFDYFMQTQGPGIGPQISVLNAIKFLANVDKFRVVDDIARNPNDVSDENMKNDDKTSFNLSDIRSESVQKHYTVTTEEVINEIAPGIFINSWTFDGTIPGKFMRARLGDNVSITIKNLPTSLHTHSIDLHAVTGQGGGAAVTQVKPGEEKTFSFKALNPGLYVYHCATPNIGVHTAHGMYGLILIEPEESLEKVDKEFYIMQGEFYTQGSIGNKGLQIFDVKKYLLGDPTYIFFNGKKEAVNGKIKANVGDKIRLYVGNGGVNLRS